LDGVVAEAARRALHGDADAISRRIITMLPEAHLDGKGFARVEIGTVVRVPYATRQMRRCAMVMRSDAVVAVGGSDATREVIDLAYVAGKPLIPISATGGAAQKSWLDYRHDLELRLHPTVEELSCFNENGANPDLSRIVDACLSILKRVLLPRCFVAMPFSDHPLANAFETILGVVKDCCYQAVRVDRETFSGSIVEEVWDSIHHCDVAIIDLTDHRPNVYYEMGIAHALNKPTILVMHSEDGTVPGNIPFDIRVQRILPYGTTQSLRAHLKAQLPVVVTQHRPRH
jgi:hypothetical protein